MNKELLPVTSKDQLEKATQGSPKGRTKRPIWVIATGTLITRTKKARFYLQKTAWVPTEAENRQKSLLVIACNLRLYHWLPMNLSIAMVMEHYNPRCKDSSGMPAPWTLEEISAKFQRAGGRKMYPTLGVSDPKAKQMCAVHNLEKEVKRFIRYRTVEGGSCTPLDLRNAFISFRDGVEVNATAFGRAVAAVTGIRTITPFGKRIYRGFHVLERSSGRQKKTKGIVSLRLAGFNPATGYASAV